MFWAKSSESLEKKIVAFCVSAKICKRVRKRVKRKEIGFRGRCPVPERELLAYHPAVFVKAESKGVTGVTFCK
jgi:hypothetical protein